MVVCSRIKDYEALSERLRLRSAIYVQPLTPQQVDQYLEQVREPLTALKTVLNQNAEIKTFAASPLILSVMSLAYQGCSLDQFPQLSDPQAFRQQLFGAYVQRMFQRRSSISYRYSKSQTTHWLIWMAQRMVKTSQTVFLIERIQPSWLQTKIQRLRYRLESLLVVVLIFVLIFVLIGGLIGGLIDGLVFGLIFGLIGGLFYGLIFGLIFGLITAVQGNIQPVETLKWSLKAAKKSILTGSIFGLIIGLIVALIDGLIVALIFGLIGGLIGGLVGGLRGPGMQKRTQPNQGIQKSVRNALISGLIVGLIVGLIGGLFYGLISGLISGLITGGSASLRHFSLRLMLYRIGYAPWNYARFLDHAAERLFLQKVGGGYIFVHRMLLEHFAQMELQQGRQEKR